MGGSYFDTVLYTKQTLFNPHKASGSTYSFSLGHSTLQRSTYTAFIKIYMAIYLPQKRDRQPNSTKSVALVDGWVTLKLS